MDRTVADKLESNVRTLANEMDNYYLGQDSEAIAALAARICELAGGHAAELAKVQNLRQLVTDLGQQVSDWQAKATRQEARAQAAERERDEARAALAELARVADPHQNMSDIPVWDALAQANKVLGND